MAQDVIGYLEGFKQRCLAVDGLEQAVIWDNDQRIDRATEVFDGRFGIPAALLAFESERFGCKADDQDVELLGNFGHDMAGTATGTTTGTEGNEDHISTFDGLFDLIAGFQGSLLANRGVSTSAETTSGIAADVDFDVGFAVVQGLGISVDYYKLHTLNTGFYHPVNCCPAGTTHSYNFDAGERFNCWIDCLWHETCTLLVYVV